MFTSPILTKTFQMSAVAMALALAGCGGGGGGHNDTVQPTINTGGSTVSSSTSGTTVSKTDKYNVFVSTSKSQLNTGTDNVVLNIQVTDNAGGIAPDGTTVAISIADAAKYGLSLDQSSTLMTSGGKVTVKVLQSNIGILSQLDHTANITVKAYDATSNVATTTLSMKVAGTSVKNLLASKYLVATTDTITVTGEVVDGSDTDLANTGTVTLLNNGTSTGLTATLNQGKFSFDVPVSKLTADTAGQYNLSVQVAGSGATQTLTSSIIVKAISANPNAATLSYTNNGAVSTGTDIPVNTATRTVTLQLPTSYQAGTPVYVSATKALINGQSGRQQVTVSGNTATFTIKSAVTGSDKLTVEYNVNSGGVTTTQTVEDTIGFVSISPAKLALQVEKTVVSASGSTNVIAKVLDANDAPVKNAIVSFMTTQDASGGQLSNATAKTDASGIATVTYNAGNNPAPQVQLSANVTKIVVDGTETTLATALNATSQLTVQNAASYIGLGFSDKITSSTDNVYYYRNGSIYVTNSVGQPAANQPVSISVVPTNYYAGEFRVGNLYSINSALGVSDWVRVHTSTQNTQIGNLSYQRTYDSAGNYTYTLIVPNGVEGALVCKAEDVNNNGYMDTGEDKNGNGQLDPINPVTILSSSGQAMGAGAATMTTDSTGKLDFQIRYAKDTAEWFDANVKVSTKVDGTESVQNRGLDFPSLIDDVSLATPLRPNWVSPFAYRNAGVMGTDGYCTKPN